MGTPHPFRFGIQAFEADSSEEWHSLVRRAEDRGYSTLFGSDHYFGPGAIAEATGHRPVDLAPLTSIAIAAAVTTDLRVGCRVFACDFHNAVVLAKETATLDMLSGGRLEVGLGAGWIKDEYLGLGIEMDAAGIRINRLAEYVDVLRAHWTGEQLEFDGVHVQARGFAGRPMPAQQGGPPIMIGGGAPKVLGVAGRLADIVSVNFNNAGGRLGGASVASSGVDQTLAKLDWIRNGAGSRFDDLELEIGAYFVGIGASAAVDLQVTAARFGVAPETLARHPHALFGSVDQVCETLQQRREEYGFSYVTVAQRHLDEFAPVVERLARL